MRNWENALNKFLDRYINEDYYEGAIACGSYVNNNNNEFSDIDVHIILKRDNSWRERGNIEIDGYLIEYFANPVNQYEKELEEEKYKYKNYTTIMFATGVVVNDKNGEAERLKNKAIIYNNLEINDITDFELQSRKYHCWDKIDELRAIYHEKRDNFYIVYYRLYEELLDLYHKINKIREFSITKLDKIIDNQEFRNKYGIKNFYNESDSNLIRKSLNIHDKEIMMKNIEQFYNRIMDMSGGFDIKHFALRSKVDSN